MRLFFKNKWLQLKNSILHTGKKKYLLFALLGIGVLLLMGYVCMKVFGFIYTEQEFPDFFKIFLCEKILNMTFLTMFVMLILSSLISTLNLFFISKDLNLLFTSPISAGKVYSWKAIEVLVNSSLIVVFFSLPVLFAYSYYFISGLFNLLAVVMVFSLFVLSGVMAGVIIGQIIPVFFSVKKLQLVFSLVSISLISSIVIFLRLLRPEKFSNPEVIHNLLNYMKDFDLEFVNFLPSYWIARGISAVSKSDPVSFWHQVGTFCVVVASLASIMLFIQKKYYLKLFDKINKGNRGLLKCRWKPFRLVSSRYDPLWKKELRTFFRTSTQWSQLLIVAAIIIIYVLNIEGIPLPHPSVKKIIAYLNMGMAAFIIAGLNSRFAFTALPLEQDGICHVITSPLKRSSIFHFKLLFYLIPQLFIGFLLFFIGDIALNIDSFARLSGILFLLPVIPFLTLLSFYFSLKVPDSTPLSPQHLIVSRSGISSMLWSLSYIVLCMIYFIRPSFLYYFNTFRKRSIPEMEIALWFIGFIVLNTVLLIYLYRKSLVLWKSKQF